jgi:subtilase family serine protease
VNSGAKVAKFESNSYGESETSTEQTSDTKYYKHAGKAIVASAGDSGYGVSYPAASQYVTSVGGTTLTKASGTTRGYTETVWGSAGGGEGTGSGCSAFEAKPTWQTDTGCSKRTDNDVSADANPNTGAAIYDSYSQGGWLEVGGTSESSPIIASVFALAGTPTAGTYPSSYPYAHTSDLYDVTSGANGSCSPAYLCHAETGYDGPTGLGTPNGVGAFTG